VAPGPVLTGEKYRPHRDSIPDRPARSSVAIPTELPCPLRVLYIPQMNDVCSTEPTIYTKRALGTEIFYLLVMDNFTK